MSEAVEYRIKRNRQTAMVAIAVLLFGVSLVLWAIAVAQSEPAAYSKLTYSLSVVTCLLGYTVLVRFKAIETDGYCRVVNRKVFGELADPPLDEWEESLEERDAFAVTL